MKPFTPLHRDASARSVARVWLTTSLLALTIVASAGTAQAAAPDPTQFNGFDVANASVPTQAIQRGGPPKDGIPAIDRPKFVPAAAVRLADEERVLGHPRTDVLRAS